MPRPCPTRELLDLSGLRCPLPILRTKKALATLNTGALIELVCTDPATPADFTDFCARTGHNLVSHWQDKDKFHFIIQKR